MCNDKRIRPKTSKRQKKTLIDCKPPPKKLILKIVTIGAIPQWKNALKKSQIRIVIRISTKI